MRNPALITKIEKGSKWSIPCCWLRRGCVNPCTSLSGLPTPCTALIFTNNKTRLKLSFWFQIRKDVKWAIRRHVDYNFWFTTGLIFFPLFYYVSLFWKLLYFCVLIFVAYEAATYIGLITFGYLYYIWLRGRQFPCHHIAQVGLKYLLNKANQKGIHIYLNYNIG